MTKLLLCITVVQLAGCAFVATTARSTVSCELAPTAHRDASQSVEIRTTASASIVEIRSSFGIGRGTIRKGPTDTWPERLIVRLHLGALEGFEATPDGHAGDRFTYNLKHEQNAERARQRRSGRSLAPIDVEIPRSVLRRATKTIAIQWVDWYRG